MSGGESVECGKHQQQTRNRHYQQHDRENAEDTEQRERE
jgi:hypothetical protein